MKKIKIFCIFFLLFIPNITYALDRGIDVSDYQGNIDFRKVKEDQIEVVYIRTSVGNSFEDVKFRQNYEEAKKNNLKVGFYHFLTARNVEESREQARFFAHVIAGTSPDCKLAIDFEQLRGLSNREINEIATAFLDTTKELTKKEMIIYADAYNASSKFDHTLALNYPLWIAEYDVDAPEVGNWSTWAGWQYTDEGRINGIYGYVDRDLFKDEVYLSDKTEIPKPEVKEEDKLKVVYYKVQRKDTLSSIANVYHVSVSDLKKWNNLSNNTIYPNQILKIYTDYTFKVKTNPDRKTYTVKYGDTLSYIAYKYHVTVTDLVDWNAIKNPNLIYPNQILYVSSPNNEHVIKYKVVRGDTLYYIARDFHTSINELVILNHIKNPNLIYIGQTLFIPESK